MLCVKYSACVAEIKYSVFEFIRCVSVAIVSRSAYPVWGLLNPYVVFMKRKCVQQVRDKMTLCMNRLRYLYRYSRLGITSAFHLCTGSQRSPRVRLEKQFQLPLQLRPKRQVPQGWEFPWLKHWRVCLGLPLLIE